MNRPRIALIGTGGTIASLGDGPFDVQDYGRHGRIMDAAALLAHWPAVAEVAEVTPLPFRAIPSTALGPPEWLELAARVREAAAAGFEGIVVAHGTATLEETAWFLALACPVEAGLVLVGAQRPSSALSSDAGQNLADACRVAGDPGSRGLGALVVMNGEVQAARDVTKTHTARLHTFRTPDYGVLGHAEADGVHWHRRPVRPVGGFDVAGLPALPRVDIVPCYAGADGAAVAAFLAAGARGLVLAGFAPSGATPALAEALRAAPVPVVAATRAAAGPAFRTTRTEAAGWINAGTLRPAKARILLMLALATAMDPREAFARY
ncbi:asparaginase [Roseococcus sp. DSY-14]|uniref:asparaginase n=1 Tax=Roseococcus sp. DSY-14 TaxID=3369650 RepID=UPI00387B9CCD